MEISEKHVEAYENLMNEPKKYNLEFESISEVFKESTDVIAKHIAYEQYLKRISKNENQLPKVFFYIVMDKKYKQSTDKDGNLGYCIEFN